MDSTYKYRKCENVQVRSTWPNGIYPGEHCLPYDGSKVPDCSEYVNPDHYVPYYHEHSASKGRVVVIIEVKILAMPRIA